MLKVETLDTPSPGLWMATIKGARNPMNSWDKMDTCWVEAPTEDTGWKFQIGYKDLELLVKLRNAGTPDHRKFMRALNVTADITAPLYWWKEFDTYKIGTVANSCSTMHKIHAKPFEMDDFSTDHMTGNSLGVFENYVFFLETVRQNYMESKSKEDWYDMIQLLPSSYNQLRTVTFNYEVLMNQYHARKNHKLEEWHTFCAWVETLPYAKELIIGQ